MRPVHGQAESARLAGEPGAERQAGDLGDVASRDGRPVPGPVITGAFRLGDVRHVTASPRLAGERLGFTAEVDLASGMRRFANDPLRA